MCKTILCLSLMVFVSIPGRAQASEAPWTLDRALEAAVRNNPELRKKELEIEIASAREWEAISGHLPHLSLSGTHFLDSKYVQLGVLFGGAPVFMPNAYPQTDLQMEASLNLFDGLQTWNRYRAAQSQHNAAEKEASHARFYLEQMIHIRFYQALASEELAHVADQNIKTLETHLQLIRTGERAGTVNRVDVLRVESQLEEARAEKLLTDDNVVVAKRSFFEIIGIPFEEVPIQGELPKPVASRVPADLVLEVSAREDFEAQRFHEQAMDRMDWAAMSFWLPQISLFGVKELYKYGSFDPAVVSGSTYSNAYMLGLKFSWNLFDGGASIARKAEAQAAYKQSTETTRALSIRAPDEFETWKRRYRYNTALYWARQRTVEKSEESVRLATVAARVGAKTHSEVLDAELELFRARAGLVHAQLDAAEAVSSLELALGRKLAP